MGLKQDLVEKRNELEAKQKKLGNIMKQAGDDIDLSKITELKGSNDEKLAEIRKMHEEINDLGTKVDDLVKAVNAADAVKKFNVDEQDVNGGMQFPEGKSGKPMTLGEMFVKSELYKDGQYVKGMKGKDIFLPDVDLKTLMTESAGWAPETIRTGRVVDYATRPIQVIDTIPGGRTNQTAVVYMEETTFTNNAAEVAEGLTSTNYYGEAALVLTERTSNVRKIGVWLPVTDEQLEDVAQIQGYLNRRLSFMLRQRLDSEILVGDGSAPNLSGVLNTSGIQTFAKSGDVFDAIYDAAKRVRVTGRAQPNTFYVHPNDWQPIRLARTNDGLYILGNPDQPGPSRIWGLMVVETDAITENTSLVGDTANYIELVEKRGIEVKITDSHDVYFIQGKQAIRADMRVALPIYRPAAFCAITSM
jgi:HK97 family phage major capsid protein